MSLLKRLSSGLAVVSMLAQPAATAAQAGQSQPGRGFEFHFTAIDGSPLPLDAFKGRALLIVNTASFCGYTQQYSGLQHLHEKYGARGLVVIGVPSNDFGAQEPKANGDIAAFCQGAFNITFPLAEKQIVSGNEAHPFYRWARTTLGDTAAPRWNFHKYLVGRDGRLIAGYSAQTAPGSATLVKAIEAALASTP